MTSTAPKWRRRPEDRPAQVLEAALAEFRRRGFAATRVDDIAARAGLSKGTLYRYFDSKEAMLKALIQTSVEPVAKQVAGFADSFEGDPLEAIKTLPQFALGALSNPDMMAIPRIVIAEAGNFPEIAAYYREAVVDRVVAALVRLINQGTKRGTLRAVNPVVATRNIIGPVFVELLLSNVITAPENQEPLPNEFLADYLDILMYGLAAERPDRNRESA